jgi:hypothetical protein
MALFQTGNKGQMYGLCSNYKWCFLELKILLFENQTPYFFEQGCISFIL